MTENGIELEATTDEIMEAVKADILYWCEECDVYHVRPDQAFKGMVG